jgi:hypothetical protein
LQRGFRRSQYLFLGPNPETLEIRYSKGASEESVLTELTDKVKRFTGKEPKLVGVSAGRDPETYEIWFSKP